MSFKFKRERFRLQMARTWHTERHVTSALLPFGQNLLQAGYQCFRGQRAM